VYGNTIVNAGAGRLQYNQSCCRFRVQRPLRKRERQHDYEDGDSFDDLVITIFTILLPLGILLKEICPRATIL